MEENIEKILKSKLSNYSDIIVYVFDDKKSLKKYKNTFRWLGKNILLTTKQEIIDYQLDSYKIKNYKYMGGIYEKN